MMRQTLAIFNDAYRELNSKKLFWFVLALTATVVSSFAFVGNNSRGITALGLTLEIPILSTRAVSTPGFYKFIFSNLGVGMWLTWAATILALISTVGMIPDFLASGSIEMSLCKPIGRLRLFLTKYAAGLLFVALQVLVFSFGGFLVIGLRGGVWEPRLFLAVPLVVLFYSYLYGVAALIGVWTRSSLRALLATLLFWFFLFILNVVDVQLLTFKLQGERDIHSQEVQIASREKAVGMLRSLLENTPPNGAETPAEPAKEPSGATVEGSTPETPSSHPASTPVPPGTVADGPGKPGLAEAAKKALAALTPPRNADELRKRLQEQEQQLEQLRTELHDAKESHRKLSMWYWGFYATKTALPKTSETMDLLDRSVMSKQDRDGILAVLQERRGDHGERDLNDALEARPFWWVLGTSVGFEVLVLGLACVSFCKRDF